MAVKAKEQLTLIDITDAYSVVLTSESYTFMGNTTGAPVNSTCSTQVVAYQGGSLVQKVNVSKVDCPSGISATISDNNGVSPTVTFKATSVITASCEATITVKVDDVTFNKKFSFSVAKTGSTGTSVSKNIRYYKLQDSSASAPSKPTANPPSGWSTTEPTYASGKSLYFVDCTVYSTGSIAFSDVSLSSSYEATKDVQGQVDKIARHVIIDEDGINITADGSNTSMNIVNDAINILVNRVPVASMTTNGVIGRTLNTALMRIGNFVVVSPSDNILRLYG